MDLDRTSHSLNKHSDPVKSTIHCKSNLFRDTSLNKAHNEMLHLIYLHSATHCKKGLPDPDEQFCVWLKFLLKKGNLRRIHYNSPCITVIEQYFNYYRHLSDMANSSIFVFKEQRLICQVILAATGNWPWKANEPNKLSCPRFPNVSLLFRNSCYTFNSIAHDIYNV